MLKLDHIADAINSDKGYIRKGNHFIHNLSKELLNSTENDVIFADVIPDESSEVDDILNEFFSKTTEGADEFNWIFGGKVGNSSAGVMHDWLKRAISHTTSNKSRLLINEKLKVVKAVTDSFLTVFNTDGTETMKGHFKYTLVTFEDKSHTNLLITPQWYDMTLSRTGEERVSSYKIFYILSAGSRSAGDQSNKLVEPQYLSAFSKEYYNSNLNKVTNALKNINFSDSEVEEIFDMIHSIMHCSQFTTKGNKKALEFIGMEHLKLAARRLKVKFEQLHDFLIQEYTWKENKKQLNTPENINRRIGSFMVKLYEVILTVIFNRINDSTDLVARFKPKTRVNFIYSMPLPRFDDIHVFNYGDFVQYGSCSDFELTMTTILDEKISTFGRSSAANMITPLPNDENSNCIVKKIKEWISTLIIDAKEDKKIFDNLKKLEKNYDNKIKFYKENVFTVQIFIPELRIFTKFNWESFIEGAETYDTKQMTHLLKMSPLSIFHSFNSKTMISLIPKNEFSLNIPMAINTFVVHSLIKDDLQDPPRYSLADQIRDNKLAYLTVEEIGFFHIGLEAFISRYRMLFLNHNDESRRHVDASNHAIKLLKLGRSWCCDNYVHLDPSHIERLEVLRENYMKSVIIVQGYFRIISSKLKLQKLRMKAISYKDTYKSDIELLEELSKNFDKEYSALCFADLENVDLTLFKQLTPTFNEIEDLKDNDFHWLQVTVIEGSNVLAKRSFGGRQLCICYSDNDIVNDSNMFDLHEALPQAIDKPRPNPFIMKVELSQYEDVMFEFRSKTPMYAWGQKSEVNRKIHSNMSHSSGVLYQEKEYKLFSLSYLHKKIAYCVMNRKPYPFTSMILECSFAVLIEEDQFYSKSLSKSPLWLFFTNIHPIANLSSHYFFKKVDKEIRKIDKKECRKFVLGPSIRPKDDWLTENVYTELMLIALEGEQLGSDLNITYYSNASRISNTRPSMASCLGKTWSKINYKQRKYMLKSPR